MTDAALTAGGWIRKDAAGRTYQPVRAQSQVIAPHQLPKQQISHAQANEQIAAVRALASEGREPGRRRGHGDNLSPKECDVYAYLVRWQARTGQVYPSCAMIAADKLVNTTVRCVRKAIRKLKTLGLIAGWLRRCVFTGRPPGEPGPQVEQDSNFYFMAVPAIVRERLAKMKRDRLARRDAANEWTLAQKDRQTAEMKRQERREEAKGRRKAHDERKAAQRARGEAWWSKITGHSLAVAALDAAADQAKSTSGLSRDQRDVPEG